jgi:hypothetical protein
VTGPKRCRKLQALTPGSAASETTVRGRLRMFVFDSKVSVSEDSDQFAERARTVTDDLCGCTGTARSPDPRVLFSEFDYVDNSGRPVHDDAWAERIASGTGKGRHR